MIHRVGHVHQPQQISGLAHDLAHVAAHVEGVARHVHQADVGGVHPRITRIAANPSSTQSSGCGSIRTSMPSRSMIGSNCSIER